MLKKLAIIAFSAVLLGGCTLLDNVLKPGDAAKDAKSDTVAPPSPTPDSSLESMPSTSASDDVTSLETDIGATTILDENFSDLE
jgi:PBP1b-binding outer membrane lipoprotein LpoB